MIVKDIPVFLAIMDSFVASVHRPLPLFRIVSLRDQVDTVRILEVSHRSVAVVQRAGIGQEYSGLESHGRRT